MTALLDQLELDLMTAARGVAMNAAIRTATAAVRELERSSPFVYSIVKEFFTGEPQDVLRALAAFDPRFSRFIENRYAANYVRLLQQDLLGD